MDLNRIFMKNASPTKVGGMAILDGLMMRGSKAIAIAIRKPDGDIHLTVEPVGKKSKWLKLPIVRGVVSFVSSLVTGTSVLLYSAEVADGFEGAVPEEKDKLTIWLEKKFGEKGALNVMLYASVVLSIVLTVGLFILLPTWVLSLAEKAGVHNVILLNLLEGILRILIFIGYILFASKMPEIRTTFEYHGAEHKTIHCYENGLELTPENAQQFYTLHPRCGTSFMMFVMIISLLVFSFFGWPNLAVRLVSRLLLIPVIAGLSYELLQWTGRHNNKCVKCLSLPGICLQKLTTNEPSLKQLEVAIAAMNAVLPSHEDASVEVETWVGTLHQDGSLEKDEAATEAYKNR